MGNRMCASRRRPVEERLTRPQRLPRQPSDVDYKKLGKLILSEKLAPCFDAVDDPDLGDLEECPICFLYYPSLNRSRCCAKGICTECFLQMKPSNGTHPAQCPFCKTPCYAVEYSGSRTEEEKALEQAEEQKVIEAKIRMQHECQNVERVMPVDQLQSLLEIQSPLSNSGGLSSDDERSTTDPESLMLESLQLDGSLVPDSCSTRHQDFDVDLEEIMVMEAIWQSLQDPKLQKSRSTQASGSNYMVRPNSVTHAANNAILSSSGPLVEGVAASIARSAEHYILQQQLSEPICDRNQTTPNLYGDFVEEPNETGSEIECLANCSFIVEDDPSGSFSPQFQEGNQGMELGLTPPVKTL